MILLLPGHAKSKRPTGTSEDLVNKTLQISNSATRMFLKKLKEIL